MHNVDNKTKGLRTMVIALAFFNWKKILNLPCQSSPFHVKTDSVHHFTALLYGYGRGGPDMQWLLKEHIQNTFRI